MKKLLLALAVVGATLFTACNKDQDCGHEFIEHDFTQDIVGTWTYLSEDGLAEAMVIKEDGSFAVTGIMAGGYMYESKGSINVVNNKVSLVFEGDKDIIEGRLELVAGKSLSIVINEEYDIRLTYDYCANDLSDEIIGMWVCNDGWTNDIAIQTYTNDGKCFMTTATSVDTDKPIVNSESDYVVVGDMLFRKIPAADGNGYSKYITARMVYAPNGTSFGDIMTHKVYIPTENGLIENVGSWLRVKQNLNFTGKVYDYNTAYVSNVKGKDEDFTIFGHTFNIANLSGANLDVFFRSELFCLETNANSIKHHYRPYGREVEIVTPITVDGNSITLDFSAILPALRKVEMFMFQDADDSQLHIYMPTASFINYFANLEVVTMLDGGKLDPTDATAVAKVFADMEARIESINVSFVMKARK